VEAAGGAGEVKCECRGVVCETGRAVVKERVGRPTYSITDPLFATWILCSKRMLASMHATREQL
jgi:hypothetical protein